MLGAASRFFADQGFAGASMDDIAAAAGISKPMLYTYFGSKEGLFAACAKQAATVLLERVRAAGEAREQAPDERLWSGLLAVFEFVDEHREGWSILFPLGGMPGGPIGGAAFEARSAMKDLLAGLFASAAEEEGIAPEVAAHADALAVGFTAATVAMASAWLEDPGEPKELQALRVMNLAWMGFGDILRGRLWLPPQGEAV